MSLFYSVVNIMILLIIILTVIPFGYALEGLPFPNLTDFTLEDIGKPVHIFEGLDYDALPEPLKTEYRNCYVDHYRCIRFREVILPVCGYDTRHWHYLSYYSPCELNLDNCVGMVNWGRDKYGSSQTDRLIFLMGEGDWCQHNTRREAEIMKRFILKMRAMQNS